MIDDIEVPIVIDLFTDSETDTAYHIAFDKFYQTIALGVSPGKDVDAKTYLKLIKAFVEACEVGKVDIDELFAEKSKIIPQKHESTSH